MGLISTQGVCMGFGKIEHFEGRVIVGGNYAFIWYLSGFPDELIKILTNRENLQNPEPFRPILGCSNCPLLEEYRKSIREGSNPWGRRDKEWIEISAKNAEQQVGLELSRNDHLVEKLRPSGDRQLKVTGWCWALNALYRKEVEAKANCAEELK